MGNTAAASPPVPLRRLAWTFLYIGIAGYGGGPAIIGFMKQLLAERYQWVGESDFFTGLSLSQLLPGATAMNMVMYLGYQIRGSLGALIAPVCFIFPAMVLMIILSAIYFAVGEVPLAQALFTGIGAVVVSLLLNATVILGRSAIKDWWAAGIAVLGLTAVTFIPKTLVVPPIFVVVAISALAGWVIYGRLEGAEPAPSEPPSPRPPTPRWFWWGWMAACGVGTAVVLLTLRSTATTLFLSMLYVGMLTFGGGFTSIPLYQHQAIEMHHWLTLSQFRDGIALGQITPGPVLITGTFIGYRAAGVWGGVLGTMAVFLPGLLGMFFIAHQHERVRHLRWLRHMVRGIVAGFIGVMVNIIIVFARQSLTDWRTITLAAAALLVLLWWKKDPVWVILGTAVVSPVLFYR